MTDLKRELQSMLKERAEEAHSPSTIPRRTLRRARTQKAVVTLGASLTVVALAVGGSALTGASDRPPDEIADSPTPQVVASESVSGESWELAVSLEAGEICARLEVTKAGRSTDRGGQTCAAEDEVLDARLSLRPPPSLAWGSVSTRVSKVDTEQWGFSPHIGHEPPEFFEIPSEFGTERRLFIAFDPNGIDAVTAKNPDGDTIDMVAVGAHEPQKIVSGSIEDSAFTLTTRPTVDGNCLTIEVTTRSKRGRATDMNDLCGIRGDSLSLTQASFDGLDSSLVFGVVPFDAKGAVLELEDGSREKLELKLRGGVRDLESYYFAIVDDVTVEGAIVSVDRAERELDRRALCAPDSPQMVDRGSVNVALFCGDGLD